MYWKGKSPIRGSQSSTILEFIKEGVKIECQKARSQEQIEACKSPEASNHFSDKIELKKVEWTGTCKTGRTVMSS